MIKRLEDLETGDTFELDGHFYVLSSDYKRRGDMSCISLVNGNSKWINPDQFIEHNPVYYLDHDNNVIAIKPLEKPANA